MALDVRGGWLGLVAIISCRHADPAGSRSTRATATRPAHTNLFIVPLDDERRWYRYHHLFGELLRQRLGQSLAPGEIAALHSHASAWCEQSGLLFEAFRHAAANAEA